MRTLIYTCADKEYSCWIPLYCLGMLMHNTDIDIEIGIEGTASDDIHICLEHIRRWYPNSKILLKENFFITNGNKTLFNNKKIMHNTVRFITEPIIKSDYVYIGDIDIICMENNIFQQHIDHMNSLGLVYSNIVRKNNPTHFSGLHFSKYNAYYPLPDISKLNLIINDEIILKNIVELKGHKINYDTNFRPIHGIHFSKNRPTVEGDGKKPGWEADGWKNEWINFCKSEEYKTIYPHLTPFVKKQIEKLNKYYNIDEKINLCIVHYNTPYMTECLIKSINKYTPNCNIYIFDNSDKEPFTYKQDNITIFDNTKGQIINFDEWLKQFNLTQKDSGNGFASAKHSISIDKCFDLINDNFILLDSDILLKKDISPLYDDRYMYVGEIDSPYKRLLPYICFINVKKCKKFNIRYLDYKYIPGIYFNTPKHTYDTGGGFYVNTKIFNNKEITISNYITHYKGGSWDINHFSNVKEHGTLTPNEWLEINKQYFTNTKNKRVIYTCLTGNYEKLIDPSFISKDFDYICFTDDLNLKSSVWELRPIPNELLNLSKVKQQRCVKICPHKYLSEYDLSIWVDACIDILSDLNVFLDECCDDLSKSIFIPKHPNRNCIYEESKACLRLKKDTINNMNPQINKYKEENYPVNNGMVQTGIMVRKHNDKSCVNVMELWENELVNHSHRDQLSFNYVLWKTNNYDTFKYLDKSLFYSKYFKWYSLHNRVNKNNIILKQTSIILEKNENSGITNNKTISNNNISNDKKIVDDNHVNKVINTNNLNNQGVIINKGVKRRVVQNNNIKLLPFNGAKRVKINSGNKTLRAFLQ